MSDFQRIMLKSVECHPLADDSWQLLVSLGIRDQVYTGEVISYRQEANFESVAAAALKAISYILPQTINLQLVDAGQTYAGRVDMPVFIVVVQIIENGKSTYVSGSSLVVLPIMRTPAKAVLNALNRVLTKCLLVQ